MSEFRVIIPELDELLERLNDIPSKDLIRAFRSAVGRHTEDIKRLVQEYPPASIANSPNNPLGKWYERGYGPRWEGGGRRTSEQLGRKWSTVSKPLYEEIRNTASYAIYVQGNQQATFHERRGWRRLDKEGANRLPRIERDLAKALEGLL